MLKKKFGIVTLVCLLCLCVAMLFAACSGTQGEKGDKGESGTDGKDGISIVSVEKTDSEGLTDTYTITYSDGKTTTFTVTNGKDGVDGSDGADGEDGTDGETPYIGENGNWWIGSTDTKIPAKGQDGTDGSDGSDGQDGITPHIGENGNWFIGDKDTGVPAKGQDGQDGNDGKDGADGLTPHIGDNGNWFVGEEDTGIPAKGQDGQDGNDGKDGENGADGLTPHIGENGNWFIGEEDTGIPAKGQDGQNGNDGKDGENGADGLTPHIGENGNWFIGEEDTGIPAKGQNGQDGNDGKDGADGLTPHIGKNGNWFIGEEDTGIPATGSKGDSGNDGADGQDGVGIKSISTEERLEGLYLVIVLTDDTTESFLLYSYESGGNIPVSITLPSNAIDGTRKDSTISEDGYSYSYIYYEVPSTTERVLPSSFKVSSGTDFKFCRPDDSGYWQGDPINHDFRMPITTGHNYFWIVTENQYFKIDIYVRDNFSYKFTFDGETVKEINIEENESILDIRPDDPAKEFFTFHYWTVDGETEFDFNTIAKSDLEFIPYFTPNSYSYKISYIYEDSSLQEVLSGNYTYGDEEQKGEIRTQLQNALDNIPDGYSIISQGHSFEEFFTSPSDNFEIQIFLKQNKGLLKFDINENGVTNENTEVYFDGEDIVLSPASEYSISLTPSREGYDFIGWFDESGTKKDKITTDKDMDDGFKITLYAHWEEIIYDVEYIYGDVELISENPNKTSLSYFDEMLQMDDLSLITSNLNNFNGWEKIEFNEKDRKVIVTGSFTKATELVIENGIIINENGRVDSEYSGDIIIPDFYNDSPVKEIGECAFYNANISSIKFGTYTNIEKISEDSFRGSNLVEIEIPKTVKIIDEGAFDMTSSELTINLEYSEGLRFKTNFDQPSQKSVIINFNGTTIEWEEVISEATNFNSLNRVTVNCLKEEN